MEYRLNDGMGVSINSELMKKCLDYYCKIKNVRLSKTLINKFKAHCRKINKKTIRGKNPNEVFTILVNTFLMGKGKKLLDEGADFHNVSQKSRKGEKKQIDSHSNNFEKRILETLKKPDRQSLISQNYHYTPPTPVNSSTSSSDSQPNIIYQNQIDERPRLELELHHQRLVFENYSSKDMEFSISHSLTFQAGTVPTTNPIHDIMKITISPFWVPNSYVEDTQNFYLGIRELNSFGTYINPSSPDSVNQRLNYIWQFELGKRENSRVWLIPKNKDFIPYNLIRSLDRVSFVFYSDEKQIDNAIPFLRGTIDALGNITFVDEHLLFSGDYVLINGYRHPIAATSNTSIFVDPTIANLPVGEVTVFFEPKKISIELNVICN